jgi:hypothetical protein
MKASIIPKQPKEFEPLEFVVAIETKRELEFLWSIFNNPDKNMVDFANQARYNITEFTIDEQLSVGRMWRVLDAELKKTQ